MVQDGHRILKNKWNPVNGKRIDKTWRDMVSSDNDDMGNLSLRVHNDIFKVAPESGGGNSIYTSRYTFRSQKLVLPC